MSAVLPTPFHQADLAPLLASLDAAEIDRLDFGVIGFDADCLVRVYNTFESNCAGIGTQRVLGKHLFNAVAPCMNNYMVAQRFEDAATGSTMLDATIDYVLTLRMRPVKVKLRLLASPGADLRYVLVHRAS
jgi:photoactive yellow protein